MSAVQVGRDIRFVVALALFAAAVTVAALVLSRGGAGVEAVGAEPAPPTETSDCEPPSPRPAVPTAEQIADAEAARNEALAFGERTGFHRSKGPSLVDDSWICGYIVLPSSGVPSEAAWGEPAPIYDAPNGAVLGYWYGTAGILPIEVAEPGTFDVEAALIERNGCPELVKSACSDR